MYNKIKVPFFDGTEVALLPYRTEEPTHLQQAALEQFLQLTAADRLAASRHVHAYYRDFHFHVGGEDSLDKQMGIPANPEAIWNHVRPRELLFLADIYTPRRDVYVVIEADCDWETEHGLALYFHKGARLTKVGGQDGIVNNISAYADETMGDIVYVANDERFTTRLEP